MGAIRRGIAYTQRRALHSSPFRIRANGCRPDRFLPRGHLQRDIVLDTTAEREIVDITEHVQEIIESAAAEHEHADGGIVTVTSQHTTCAVIVNENEHFLKGDILEYLNTAVPSDATKYRHNDLQARPATARDRAAIEKNNCGGFGSVEAFMEQEPINAHAHIQAILCGNSVTFGVKDARLSLGQWQSCLFVDLDGPRVGRRATVTYVW